MADAKCELCKTNIASHIIPYTVRIKEDVYSEALKTTLKEGEHITVHLPMCEQCLNDKEVI